MLRKIPQFGRRTVVLFLLANEKRLLNLKRYAINDCQGLSWFFTRFTSSANSFLVGFLGLTKFLMNVDVSLHMQTPTRTTRFLLSLISLAGKILFESSLYSIHRSPSLYSSIFLINATSSPIYYSGAKTGLLIQRLTTYVFHPNWTLKTTDGAVTQLTTSCCKLWNRSIQSTNFHRRCSISVLQSSQFFFCSEQIMSADKCSNIYPRQMDGIVLPIPSSRDARSTLKVFCLPYICSLERGGREQTKTHWGIEEGRMKRAKGEERVFILFLPRSRSLNGCRLPSRRRLSL